MLICDAYPIEFIDLIDSLPEPDWCSPAQRRMHSIIEDDHVIAEVCHLFSEALKTGADVRQEFSEGLWTFFEIASTLPDRQPAGSHLRQLGAPVVFSTPEQLISDVRNTAQAAQDLAEMLARIAPTIGLSDAEQLIGKLKALPPTCHSSLVLLSDDSFPNPGRTGAADDWWMWMCGELRTVASVHMPLCSDELIHAVAGVLIGEV